MKPRLLIFVFSLLFSLPTRAAEIAVLDFDAYGLTYDEAALVSQGFRDAFLEQGTFFPLEGYDITDRLGSGHEADIARARKLVADARVYLNEGRASGAVVLLEEAELLHKRAGSLIGRRAQIADVYFFMGQAQLRLGRSSSANKSFIAMLNAFPGYAENRAGNVTSSVNAGMARAKTARMNQGRELMEVTESSGLARRLRVQVVVVGVVDGSGQLTVRLTQNGRIDGELTRRLDDVPPFPGDPVYAEMIRELTLNLSNGSNGGSFTPSPRFDTPPPTDFDPPPRFDTRPPRGNSESDPTSDRPSAQDDKPGLPSSFGKTRRPWWQFWKKDKAPVTGRINVGGRMGPVTQEWWFWAATGAVVAGGATAAVVLLSDGEDVGPVEGVTSTSYTLSIQVN
jgi:hypothetical protein